MRKYIAIFLIFFISTTVDAQELNCRVVVNSSNVEGTEKQRFQTLQTAITEFLNTRQWTNRKFKPEERIDCSFFINLDKNTSGENYSGSIQVQSRRPIFNSAYSSPMINIKDNDLSFKWVEHDPLNFDVNTFTNNLTSVLAFYVYVIIGNDFDSFSLLGGSEYYNTAQTVVNNAQNSNYFGWKSSENDNRYWYIENILNSKYEDYREFIYHFHRIGLDVMYDNLSKGRTETMKALEMLQKLHRVRPNLKITISLMDAKKEEFIGIFTGAPANEKEKAKKILMQIDPSHVGEYQRKLTD